ncbi:MAG: DUF1552 domain-containing protein [Myxococcota bacterium]
MGFKRLHRRTFLRGTAGAAIALPFLHAMGESGNAQGAAVKRFVGYIQPLGTLGEAFFPAAPGTPRYEIPAAGTCNSNDRCRAWTFRTGETMLDNPDWEPSLILEPLATMGGGILKNKLTVVEGLEAPGRGHKGYGALLTGASFKNDDSLPNRSVDHAIAEAVGADTRVPALQLGVRTSTKVGPRYTASWYDRDQAAVAENNPRAVFTRLFSDIATDPNEVNHLLEERRSMLDSAVGQANRLRERVGVEDRAKLDNYLESFRDVERRISIMPAATCSRPEEPIDDNPRFIERNNLEDVPEVARAQLNLLALAFACDITRSATYQMAFEATNMTHPWLGVSGRWHDLSHNGARGNGWQADMEDYLKIHRWNSELIGEFMMQLDGFGIADDVVLLWCNSMQNGQVHNSDNVPVLLAGSAGGALRTGRHIRYPEGKSLADMLVTIQQAFGMDVTSFGDPEHNHGGLSELLA